MNANEPIEVARGSTNVFRDFGLPDAQVLHMKTTLAARIIEVLDDRELTVRGAAALTGFAAADFSRVRRAKLQGFTLDRLITMLGKLDQEVELRVDVRPRRDADLQLLP